MSWESQHSDVEFQMSNIQTSKQVGHTREFNQWELLAKMMDLEYLTRV